MSGGVPPLDLNVLESLSIEGTSNEERKANLFATDRLVDPDELESFIARVGPLYSKKRIQLFAKKLQIHPGIIVGQLQHRGEIGFGHSREMLVKIRDFVTQSALTDGWGHGPPPVF